MRSVFFVFVFAALSVAQNGSSFKTTALDLNGHRVTDGPDVTSTLSKSSSQTTETMQSINGRMVPVEKVEEHVLRDDASGRLVERIIKKYDQQGNPTQPEKVVIEEHKTPNGGSTVQTSKYFADINGRLALQERSTVDQQVSGSTVTTETVVEKPSPNGGLGVAEKQSSTVSKGNNGAYQETAAVFRRDPTGNFYQAARRVTDHTESTNHATDNIAQYEVDANGQLSLHDQTVRNVDKHANGSQDVQVDMFVKNLPGIVNDTGALQLKEHQTIERQPVGDGFKETTSVQRPSMSDPRKLGPAVELSQTVCRGACDSKP